MRAASFFFPICLALCAAFPLLVTAPAAHAETIDIVFTGLDFVYDTSTVSDATSEFGGNKDPDESDPASSVIFSNGGGNQSDTSSVYADIRLMGVSGISEFGGFDKTSNGNTFGIDVFSTDGTPWWLMLDIDQLTVVYTGSGISIAAIGKASSVYRQKLPFGLPAIDTSKDIQLFIGSGSLSNIQTSGGVLTGFTAANGVGTISATLVPEPSTLLALLTGALALAAFAWRGKKR